MFIHEPNGVNKQMAKYRQNRINEEMAHEIAVILRSVKDPRVSSAFVSVTGVDCTADLKYAKIYVSAILNEEEQKELLKGLKSASGYIRGQIAQNLNLRIVPELKFIYDSSIERGTEMSKLMRKVEEELHDIKPSDDSEEAD